MNIKYFICAYPVQCNVVFIGKLNLVTYQNLCTSKQKISVNLFPPNCAEKIGAEKHKNFVLLLYLIDFTGLGQVNKKKWQNIYQAESATSELGMGAKKRQIIHILWISVLSPPPYPHRPKLIFTLRNFFIHICPSPLGAYPRYRYY